MSLLNNLAWKELSNFYFWTYISMMEFMEKMLYAQPFSFLD